jgi:signal transduction histidine kinase
LESDPLDFHGLIEETIALARSDAANRRISVTMKAAPELPLVLGDRVHLQQVLLNLMLNGMDAMSSCRPADRHLSINARVAKGGGVEVAVSDCGPGIPPDKVERVFDPFFTTKTEGMGMGLAISRNIIEAHGGKIWAENLPGRGASFIFTLRAAD